MTGRQRLLATLSGEPTDRLPIWLMRQAGRFLPEYRAIRSKLSFLELVHSPEGCTEVALQPLKRFPLDATIVFSDILTILDAAGAELRFVQGDGPSLARPVVDPEASHLNFVGLGERLAFTYAAVRALRSAAPDHALFGFAGSPWTLLCYLVEGEGSSDFAKTRTFVRRHPEAAERLLSLLADAVADHLIAQIAAGADAVQVFDTWGGLLSAKQWATWSAPSLVRIRARLVAAYPAHPHVLFVRAGHLLEAASAVNFTVLSVHDTADLAEARRLTRFTQGNIDNTVLLAGQSAIEAEVQRLSRDLAGDTSRHIVNLGHGILPHTPPEAVTHLCEAVARIPVSR